MFCSKVAVFALLPLAAVSALPFEKREPEPGRTSRVLLYACLALTLLEIIVGDFFGSVFNEATSDGEQDPTQFMHEPLC